MKKTAILPRSRPGASFQAQEFIDNALIGAKANRITKEIP